MNYQKMRIDFTQKRGLTAPFVYKTGEIDVDGIEAELVNIDVDGSPIGFIKLISPTGIERESALRIENGFAYFDIPKNEEGLYTVELTILNKKNKTRSGNVAIEVINSLSYDSEEYETLLDTITKKDAEYTLNENVRIENEKTRIETFDGIKTDFENLTAGKQLDSEVIIARNGKASLKENIESKRDKSTLLTQSDLSTASESHKITPNHLNQAVKDMMTGSTPVNPNIADGQITTEKLAVNAVVPDKISFIKIGKNKINQANLISGILDNDGTVAALDTYRTTEYIEVKQGAPVSINNCRAYAIYDATKKLITFLNTGSTTAKVENLAIAQNGFIRVSAIATNLPTWQLELGAACTNFEEYHLEIEDLYLGDNSVDTTMIVDGTILTSDTDFIEQGKNIINPSKLQKGTLSVDGNLATLDTYRTTGYIPVKAGDVISINNCRWIATYDKRKVNLTATNNSSNTFKLENFVIAQDGFIRTTTIATNIGNWQMEFNVACTEFEEYRLKIDGLKIAGQIELPLSVSKDGNYFTVADKTFSIRTQKNGSANGSFNFIETKMGSDVIHATTDDITPIRTFSTVGANHGYTSIAGVFLDNHGKTQHDLGSKWTDGITEYILIKVESNLLTFGCPYVLQDKVVSATQKNPVANLTHVSGATNPSAISTASLKAAHQLYPSTNKVAVRYILDGTDITNMEDGTYFGNKLVIVEKYNIIDYAAIIDYSVANLGQSYADADLQGVVEIAVSYTFDKNVNCSVSHSIKALKDVILSNCGFLQSVIPVLSGHDQLRYMPNVLPKGGYDFSVPVNMNAYNSTIDFNKADLTDATKTASYYVDWLSKSGVKKVGFSMGYIIDKTDAKESERLKYNKQWNFRNTKKSYPTAVENLRLVPGEYKTFAGFRNYLLPSDMLNKNIVRVAKDVYVYLDSSVPVNSSVELLDKLGAEIKVIQSSNFTLLNNTVDVNGVNFKFTGKGNAILKV